jgi:hypothetical protein
METQQVRIGPSPGGKELVDERERSLQGFEAERDRLKVLLAAAAAIPWIPGFIWGWKIGLFCGVSALIFYGVGRYINFFHVREARQLLSNAREQLNDNQ